MLRLFVIAWIAFNLATCGGAVVTVRAAWKHLPEPLPQLVQLFMAPLWFGLLLVSGLSLVKALIARGAFDAGEAAESDSQPSTPGSQP